MVNAKLAADSIQVGTKVFTVARPQKLNKFGNPYVSRSKNEYAVFECVVQDITFTERANTNRDWEPAVLLTLAAEELIPGLTRPYYRFLEGVPVEECFHTFGEAKNAMDKMRGESV